IDQKAGSVIYANTAAVELAGHISLPVDIDTWGAAAGLTDLAGSPLASTESPLSLVAQGQPVTGEAVRLSPGRSSEPTRAQPDNPLAWVNPSFSRVTGYEYDEAVGRNCRFLQGPATDPRTVAEIRAALEEPRTITATLLNYRKDGTAFWNQLSISPVFDGAGELVSFVGVQTDVTERVRVESEREAAFAAEQAARQEAELARAIAEQVRTDAERAQESA